MTNENGEKRGPLAVIGQIEIWDTHIGRGVNKIPDDSNSPSRLNIGSLIDDVAISMDDTVGDNFVFPMRLRSFAGAGMFPHIPPILNHLAYDLEKYQGQIPPDYKSRKWPRMDGVVAFTGSPDYSEIQIKIGENTNEPKYTVRGIPDEDGNERFLDIEVAQSGEVKIKMRDDYFKTEGTMIFKTVENGGKYPILAEAFTKIAEIIAESQLPTPAT